MAEIQASYVPSNREDQQCDTSPDSSANKDTGTTSRARCAPSDKADQQHDASPGSSTSDANPVKLARKRSFSHVSASTEPTRRNGPPNWPPIPPHDQEFCTQLCILGVRNNAPLDNECPNVELHRCHPNQTHHPITADELVLGIKEQLRGNLDIHITPLPNRGEYAMPFKLTLTAYGYTVVGKGTTASLWSEVSKEIDVYRILQKLQGDVIPVFLGSIDLARFISPVEWGLSGICLLCHMAAIDCQWTRMIS